MAKIRSRRKKDRYPKGEKHGMAKLKTAQVIAIRNDTRSLGKIAREYRISPSMVRFIRLRQSWKHVP
jgi:hypothetical protein